ncbi:hypothetical protein P5V15_002523 [Pogonomyrmex californicus]
MVFRNRNRLQCYVCDAIVRPRQLARINGDNLIKREITIIRRDANNLLRDPTCLRLNILTQTSNHTCMILNVFVTRNIYIPETAKCCRIQLDHNGLPYMIRGQQLQIILQELRRVSQNGCLYNDENSFTDKEFKSIAFISKDQFRKLFTFCDPVPREESHRYVLKRVLLLFLCKLHQGLSDEFLKFNYPNSERSLMQRFVPQNIDFQAITRDQFIERHVNDFANDLYNPQSNEPRELITLMEPIRHLVKPAFIVALDGYILTIQGPYFSDSRNNDAEIFRNEYARDNDAMKVWFQDGDIFVVDRGLLLMYE